MYLAAYWTPKETQSVGPNIRHTQELESLAEVETFVAEHLDSLVAVYCLDGGEKTRLKTNKLAGSKC